MRLRVLSSLLLLFFPACQLAAQATSNAQKFSPPTRTFRFTYNFTVKDIPSGAKRVRVCCRRLTSIRLRAFCRSRLQLKRG
ncbi:MAG TPA: hypothetical protein VJK29_11070 [Terriglobales bacterium]|nr:hypothetical protein [Terriglobales bacterium]